MSDKTDRHIGMLRGGHISGFPMMPECGDREGLAWRGCDDDIGIYSFNGEHVFDGGMRDGTEPFVVVISFEGPSRFQKPAREPTQTRE